ncbi:MAG: hypothetical protein IJI57_02425 [Flexilinea sp.]|nr:hypothetical protein [Flexilinea sp.]
MRKSSSQQFAWSAENNASAFNAMYADSFYANFSAAIIPLMAVVFIIGLCSYLALSIIISVILGVIILIVRGEIKPVSRTR